MQLYDSVIRWWFLCALEPACIAPTTDLYCKFHGTEEYGHCHRYDQSAINILLANYFEDDYRAYFAPATVDSVLSVERGSQGKEEIFVCDGSSSVARFKSKNYF